MRYITTDLVHGESVNSLAMEELRLTIERKESRNKRQIKGNLLDSPLTKIQSRKKS